MKNIKTPANQWVTQCDPKRSVTDLVIPGTHDTMTSSCNDRYYRTQTLSLEQQLQIGVRFLDIRLTKEMVAAHREWISDISAVEIFDVLGEFLYQNPNEFILVRLQNANEKKDDFSEYGYALVEQVNKYIHLFHQWKQNETTQTFWPDIASVAGKMIAIECSPPDMKLNYLNNHTMWAANWHNNPHILLQDLWDAPTLAEKQNAIKELVIKSQSVTSDTLFLNHISATNGTLGFPNAYAEQLNLYTTQLWQQDEINNMKGVQIYDFITPDLSQNLLALNF